MKATTELCWVAKNVRTEGVMPSSHKASDPCCPDKDQAGPYNHGGKHHPFTILFYSDVSSMPTKCTNPIKSPVCPIKKSNQLIRTVGQTKYDPWTNLEIAL